MVRRISVRIVGFFVEGNAARMTFEFSNKKRIQRVLGLDEAQEKRFQVGKYFQLYIGEEEYQKIFRAEVAKPPVTTWIDFSQFQA